MITLRPPREALEDALDHIARTAERSRTQSTRIRWIAARARSAINGDNSYRQIVLPKNGLPIVANLTRCVFDLEQQRTDLLDALQALRCEASHDQESSILSGPEFDALLARVDDVIARATGGAS